jgi:hypothetical protein
VDSSDEQVYDDGSEAGSFMATARMSHASDFGEADVDDETLQSKKQNQSKLQTMESQTLVQSTEFET